MDKDAAKCDICRKPVVWPSHYGDWECPHCHQPYEYDEGLKITLNDAQWAILRNPPQWIQVSERPPESERVVLICHNGTVGMARLYSDGWYWDMDEWHKPFTPTHWMPLPEPPEVKS
jgi:hypothetical protein